MTELEEGDNCPSQEYPACLGRMQYDEVENCSCHINPPCSACMDNQLTCPDCGYKEEEL